MLTRRTSILLAQHLRRFCSTTSRALSDIERTDYRLSGVPTEDVPDNFVDLADFHQDLGTFESARASREFYLSPDQVDFFKRNGYVAPVDIVWPDEVTKLLEEYVEVTQPGYPGRGLFSEYRENESGDPNLVLLHALGQWRCTPGFHDLAFHPAITAAASQIICSDKSGVGIRFWHDQLFAKPPKLGGNVAWHQDYSYWTRTTPMQHMTVHIALDEQTEENGCIQVIPKSHTWTRDGMPLPITALNFEDMYSIKSILTEEELADFIPTPVLLKPGQACFIHPLLVHGSYANRSENIRRATVINLFADGTKSSTHEELLHGVQIPPGEIMQGKFFPVVREATTALN